MKKTIAFVLFFGASMAGLALPVKKAGSGNWEALKTKNDPGGRSECSMAAVNGKLYLFGGDGDEPQPVECFDPKTLTWKKLAVAPIVMHHFQVVAYGSKVYTLEAFSSGGFPNQEPMANVYIYDTEKDTWEKGGEMPASRRRAGAGAALYNGKLYLVAGIQHGHSSGTTNMFDVYDPATGKWAALPDAPHIRDHSFAAVIGDKLYTAGGRNTSFRDPANKLNFFSQVVLDVDCYDFKTGTWSTLPAKLPLGTGGGALVALDDKLYYLGGERATATENNAPRKSTFFLNLALPGSQWQETDSLKQARNGVAAAVLNGKIYVAGGAGGGPGGPPPPGGPVPGGVPPPAPGDNAPDRPSGPRPGGPGMPGGGGSIAVEVFTIK
jgi:N-acetylneuraminic acid mutarotase